MKDLNPRPVCVWQTVVLLSPPLDYAEHRGRLEQTVVFLSPPLDCAEHRDRMGRLRPKTSLNCM